MQRRLRTDDRCRRHVPFPDAVPGAHARGRCRCSCRVPLSGAPVWRQTPMPAADTGCRCQMSMLIPLLGVRPVRPGLRIGGVCPVSGGRCGPLANMQFLSSGGLPSPDFHPCGGWRIMSPRGDGCAVEEWSTHPTKAMKAMMSGRSRLTCRVDRVACVVMYGRHGRESRCAPVTRR